MKKVLITGSQGFIGTHLKNYLKDKYEIIPFDIRLGWEMDVRKSMVDFVKEKKPDVIIHLAANPDIIKSVSDCQGDLELNVSGTINVLEAAKEARPELVIFTSTAQVYGEPKEEKMSENHPIAPKSPYAIAKYAAEEYCRFYHQKFDVPTVVFRFFNIYGPNQSPYVVVPALINKISKADREVEMLGSRDDSRDFIFVKDLCSAFEAAIEKKPAGETMNLGSGEETPILELAQTIAGLLKKPMEFKYKEENIESARISKMAADVEKAKTLLNWSASTPIWEGLKQTIYD
jgi:UDP-glucose 4-epimerase